MSANVKTLLENPGELYWGTHVDDPEYHYGIALDFQEGTLAVQLVYVLTDIDEDTDEALVTPDVLMSCFTVADLEDANILLSDNMEDCPAETRGWYCIELSVFNQSEIENLENSSENLDGYLDIILEIFASSPDEEEAEMSFLEDCTFFDLQEELCGISDKIDCGQLQKPLPFQFHLIGDALMGWQTANEEDFR